MPTWGRQESGTGMKAGADKGAAGSAGGRAVAAVILAAGRSTRMKTDLPKVMHPVCGQPMLAYVLDACYAAGIERSVVVVGFGKAIVTDAFGQAPGVEFVEQVEQRGTGHAVMVCAPAMKGFAGDVVVIAGDMPMVRAETLRGLIAGHQKAGAKASIATTELDDPTGYGRIVRDARGRFERIVEHRDCSETQRAIREVNPSYYCFDGAALFDALDRLKPDNAKGEYYLTDVLGILREQGETVQAETRVASEDAVGINSRVDLAAVSKVMQQRIQRRWMEQGVTIQSPDNTWIDSRAQIGAETVIEPFSTIEGFAKIGAGCRIGPYAYIEDGAVVEDGERVGPGSLTAFESTAPSRTSGDRRQSRVVRRPPTPTQAT